MQNADLISSLKNAGNRALGAGSPEGKADPSAHTNRFETTL